MQIDLKILIISVRTIRYVYTPIEKETPKLKSSDDALKFVNKLDLSQFKLKISDNLITHHFITYGVIARELKSIFPHCVYYFISSGGKRKFNPETLLRHTKEFDRVFLDWSKEKENIVRNLSLHLDDLKEMEII